MSFTGLGERLLFVNWRVGLRPAALAPVSCTDKRAGTHPRELTGNRVCTS